MADIKSGLPATRALPIRMEEPTPMRSRSALVSLTVLPNVVDELRRLGWTTNGGLLNDAVGDAVVELVERAIALGYGRLDRLIRIGLRKIRITWIVNNSTCCCFSEGLLTPGDASGDQ